MAPLFPNGAPPALNRRTQAIRVLLEARRPAWSSPGDVVDALVELGVGRDEIVEVVAPGILAQEVGRPRAGHAAPAEMPDARYREGWEDARAATAPVAEALAWLRENPGAVQALGYRIHDMSALSDNEKLLAHAATVIRAALAEVTE